MTTEHHAVLFPPNERAAQGHTRKYQSPDFSLVHLLFFLPFMSAGLYLIVMSAATWGRFLWLCCDGQASPARIVEIRDKPDEESENTVLYEVHIGDRVYRGQDEISDPRREALGGKTELQIVVSPHLPWLNCVKNDWFPAAKFTLMALLLNLMLFGIKAYSLITDMWVTYWLRFAGQIVPGTVERAGLDDDEGTIHLWIEYCFTSPEGQLIRDRAEAIRSTSDQAIPPAGSALAVLYANRRIYRLL